MANVKKVDLKSKNFTEDFKAELKNKFPQVFNEDKIDCEKLKLAIGEDLDIGRERFGMNWPGKAAAIRVAQEPSMATLKPDREASVDFDTTENLFIEGDNLETLKLLQKSYFGKIKMIYIDPPYNTGNEFIYPDKYAEGLETYLQYTGQIDAEGKKFNSNTETDGRYHSKWMNMMWSRLFLARNLLTENGVIFISIDDHEMDNLKKICNEIFGEENFLECIIWKKRATPPNDRNIGRIHEFILCYSKNINEVKLGLLLRDEKSISRYSNPDNDKRGAWAASDLSANGKGGRLVASCVYPIVNPETKNEFLPSEGRCWLFNADKMKNYIEEGRIGFREKTGAPFLKRYFSEVRDGLTLPTILTEVGYSSTSASELDKLFIKKGIFEYAKPTTLINPLIKIGTGESDNAIILDFFAGSGTTAHSVMNLNAQGEGKRKYILVQLPEKTPKESEAYKAGYKNIAQIGEERIRRAGKKILEENMDKLKLEGEKKIDFGFKVYKLGKSNFSAWDGKESEGLQQKLLKHVNHIAADSTEADILYELLLKSGYELTAKVEEIKINKKKVYSISGGELIICLEKDIDKDLMKKTADLKSKQVICLNSGFKADSDLTNAAQIMKTKEIEFRTV